MHRELLGPSVCIMCRSELQVGHMKETRMVRRGCTFGKRIRHQQLRCSKCKVAYADALWTKSQRRSHKARQTHLVCKACRDQGFHPRSLEAFTCQCCKGNFGSKRFNWRVLNRYKKPPCVKLQCTQCVAQKSEKKATATKQKTKQQKNTPSVGKRWQPQVMLR